VTTGYPAAYTALSMQDMNLRPNAATNNPGRTYKWYTGEAVYPYGYGLSYTTFNYQFLNGFGQYHTSQLMSQANHWLDTDDLKGTNDRSRAPFITYAVNVTNTGRVTSDTSVLLFVNSTVPDTPKQSLIGYVHIHDLAPGTTVTRYFDVSLAGLQYVDQMGDKWLMPGDYSVFVGHAGMAHQQHQFTINGNKQLLYTFPRKPATQPTASGRRAGIPIAE